MGSIANIKNTASRVGRALGSSAAASAVDLVTLLVLARTTQLAVGLSAAFACLLGGAVNFALSRTWVFPARRGNALRQLALYAILVVIGGALLGGAVVQLATVTLGLSLIAAKAVSAVLVFLGWNYPIASRFIFAKETAS